MTPSVAALAFLLPLAVRGPVDARHWTAAAAAYLLGPAVAAALALLIPADTFALVIHVERVLFAFGLAALTALVLHTRRRAGPPPAFWLAHAGLVASLLAGWLPAQGPSVATAGLLAGVAGTGWTLLRSR